MTQEIKVTGLADLQKFLDTLPAKMEANILRAALRAGAKPILESAKQNVPVGEPVYKCKTADGGVVVSNTPCARGVEPDAKLSSGSQPVVYETPCERVASTGSGLVQIAPQLTPQQRQAVAREEFGRLNSVGASRILAEIGRNGVLRVCAFFPGGDLSETLIETSGMVRRDGVVDADDPVARATRPRRSAIEDLPGRNRCLSQRCVGARHRQGGMHWTHRSMHRGRLLSEGLFRRVLAAAV